MWNEVKDLPPKELADFLRDDDEELLWYLQKIRSRDKQHQREKNKLRLAKNQLKAIQDEKLLEVLEFKINSQLSTDVANRKSKELRELNKQLEQQIAILREIISELENEKN